MELVSQEDQHMWLPAIFRLVLAPAEANVMALGGLMDATAVQPLTTGYQKPRRWQLLK